MLKSLQAKNKGVSMSYPSLKTVFEPAEYNALFRIGITDMQSAAHIFRWDPLTGYEPIQNFGPKKWAKLRRILAEHSLIDTNTKLVFPNGMFDFNSPDVVEILKADNSKFDLTPIADYFVAHANRNRTISVSDGTSPYWGTFLERLKQAHYKLADI